MLKALVIENFRAFGDTTRVEMAPITLVFGQNSAGKSSVLHALNLLKQTHEQPDSNTTLLPRAEHGIVDLGSFKEMLFDHDTSRVLRIGAELAPVDAEKWKYIWRHSRPETEVGRLGLQFGFGLRDSSPDIALTEITVGLASLQDSFATFSTAPLTDADLHNLERYGWHTVGPWQRGRRRRRVLGAECRHINATVEGWNPVYRAWHARRSEVHRRLSGDSAVRNLGYRFEDAAIREKDPERHDASIRKAVAAAREFYARDFSVAEFVQRMVNASLGTKIALDGLMPMPIGGLWSSRLPELSVIDHYGGDPALSLPTNSIDSIAYLAGRFMDDALDALFPMGPFRRPPERWYVFTGTSPIDVGHKGDHLPDLLLRRPDLVTRANQWLERLEIGYQLLVRPIGDGNGDVFEVRMADTRRGQRVEVGLPDVGFGVSQILPFVVQCLASDRRLLSIEQPEVHIHPRLQADLGELLAECIAPPFKHQFLIETHSEHLLLRLQRLVRKGKLQPSDVSIVLVERGRAGSTVLRLHLDENGDFADQWPGGLFSERLREVF